MTTTLSNELAATLPTEGYAFLHDKVASAVVREWSRTLQVALRPGNSGTLSSKNQIYGARNVHNVWPDLSAALEHPIIRDTVIQVLGSQAGLVRTLFFDKPPGRSWSLPWHRDKTIAVREHCQSPEFRCPTTKADIPHVEAPTWLLQEMLTLRLHLDPMTEANGPLVVVSGSHRGADDTATPAADAMTTLTCEAGAIMVMRPLLLHSSKDAAPHCSLQRRILHFEFAATQSLPDSFQWQTFIPLSKENE